MAQAARARSGPSGSMQAPSVYTSRRFCAGTAPSGGNSGQTPRATCAMARSAGSAWRRPVRACPSESLARSARRS
eukprot:6768361-Lingulodinium_polyedra.AAC.1